MPDWNAGVFAGMSTWKAAKRTVVQIGTSATLIPTNLLPNRTLIWMWNQSATKVFVAPSSDVGTTEDAAIAHGSSLLVPTSEEVLWFGRVVTGTVNIVIWEATK